MPKAKSASPKDVVKPNTPATRAAKTAPAPAPAVTPAPAVAPAPALVADQAKVIAVAPAPAPAAAPVKVTAFEPDGAVMDRLVVQMEKLAKLRGISLDEVEFLAIEAGVKALLAEPAKAVPSAPAKGMTRIKVIGPKDGRYRAGHHFSAEEATVDVSDDQLKAIEADPTLSHKVVTA